MSNLQVTLTRSPIGRPKDQKATLVGLGLSKLHKTVVLENTPSIRGMVKKVIHLVEVTEITETS
jgi:large subunit ribosomal protein L30